MFKEVVL